MKNFDSAWCIFIQIGHVEGPRRGALCPKWPGPCLPELRARGVPISPCDHVAPLKGGPFGWRLSGLQRNYPEIDSDVEESLREIALFSFFKVIQLRWIFLSGSCKIPRCQVQRGVFLM